MENQPPAPGCPLSEIDFDQSRVVLSTNTTNLRTMRINPFSPAANMRRVTPPHEYDPGERFVPWFSPDNEMGHAVAARKAAYYDNPSRVLSTANDDPAIRDVAQQLLELQVQYLVDHYPDLYEVEENFEQGETIRNKVTGDTYSLLPDEYGLHPLAIVGLLGQEDVCVVQRMDDGRQVMVAGFLASPTNWNLSDFIGLDMDGIHKEVDGYTEKLKVTVDKALENLPEYPERQFARNNGFLGINPLLGIVPDATPPIDETVIDNAETQVIFRTEYETLTRLPSTARYPHNNTYTIFTIEPRVYTLPTVKQERGADLADAIVTNKVLGRKAIIAGEAIAYLQAE